MAATRPCSSNRGASTVPRSRAWVSLATGKEGLLMTARIWALFTASRQSRPPAGPAIAAGDGSGYISAPMALALYDTMSRSKRPFVPVNPDRVTMYVCGPTVYNYAHIGNARPVVVFDVLYRLLRHLYGEDAVTYARNITDVDDKINAKAAEEGV